MTSTKPDFSSSLKYIFAFGDSYTDVGFSVSSTLHPRAENYQGNPTPPGASSAYASNYLQLICEKYKKTEELYLYSFASSGAITDGSVIPTWNGPDNTFIGQVTQKYIPYLSNKPSYAPWTSSNSLFVIWFGVNDIHSPLDTDFQLDWDTALESIMDAYWTQVDKLYSTGARNFVILNAPTIWTAPSITRHASPELIAEAKRRTLSWNGKLEERRELWARKHLDCYTTIIGIQALWEDMTARPGEYGLSNTSEYCVEYEHGTGTDLFYHHKSCPAPVNEYLWLNWVHPTWTVHEHIARLLLRELGY